MNFKIQLFAFTLLSIFFVACGDDASSNNAAGTTEETTLPSLSPEIDKLNIAIQEAPKNAVLYAERGQALWDVQGYDEAIKDMERAVELSTDTPEYYHTLANFYMDYFRSRKALKTMETAGLKFPVRIPTLLKLTEFYLILKDYGAANRTLDRIQKVSPLNAEMFYMRGAVAEDQGDVEVAESAYRFATENDPDMIDAYLKLGDLTALKAPKTALQYYNNAIRIDPKNTDALTMKAFHLSNIMNNLEEAQVIYRDLLKIDSKNKTAYHNSGLLYLDMDSLDRAFMRFTEAIKASPTAVESIYYRGVTSELKGDVSAAKDDYEQVTKMNPGFTVGKEALARVSAQVQQ
ncbi:MAG: tetratricopeptide (TPR) repeat protein [Saprospiraceae bacterium]|jgi:tetratricopeptide (TPR) repeat protein